jgi:hypothetical protein
MKNGGILRGTIVDAIPNAQARIELVTGEIATVPWEEIARIEYAAEARPAPPPPASAPAPAPAPSPPRPSPLAGPMVLVHLDGPDDAQLQQDATGDGSWRTVCSPPCDQSLPVGPDYRIEGGSFKSSSVFKLSGGQGERVTVTISGASKGWFVAGIVATAIAAPVSLISLLTGLTASLEAGVTTGSIHDQASSFASGAWTVFAVSAAALVGGIVLIVTNAKTTTTQDVGIAQAALLATPAHRPTWREPPPEEKAMPPAVGAPLWTVHF